MVVTKMRIAGRKAPPLTATRPATRRLCIVKIGRHRVLAVAASLPKRGGRPSIGST
jgi:hypothetical protein